MKDPKYKEYYESLGFQAVSEYEKYYNDLEMRITPLCLLKEGMPKLPEYLKDKTDHAIKEIEANKELFKLAFGSNTTSNKPTNNTVSERRRKNRFSRKLLRRFVKQTRKNKRI